MSSEDGLDWFVALVWPDRQGRPTARIHEWDRLTGQIGRLVEVFTFGSRPSFYEVLETKLYEAVDGLLEQPVQHDGVLVALRQPALATRPYGQS